MRLEIRGYLESKTDENSLWINLQKVYMDLNPYIRKLNLEEDDTEWTNSFNEALTNMVMDQEVRINQVNEKSVLISLESVIQEKIDNIKLSAINQMKVELNKYIESEEYEMAAEYRDMINEYESKLELQ